MWPFKRKQPAPSVEVVETEVEEKEEYDPRLDNLLLEEGQEITYEGKDWYVYVRGHDPKGNPVTRAYLVMPSGSWRLDHTIQA